MPALHRKHFVLDTGCLFLCPMQLKSAGWGPDADETGCNVGAANQLLKPTYDQGSTTKKRKLRAQGWTSIYTSGPHVMLTSVRPLTFPRRTSTHSRHCFAVSAAVLPLCTKILLWIIVCLITTEGKKHKTKSSDRQIL